MARKKQRKVIAAPIAPEIKIRFKKLMAMPPATPKPMIAGFPVKNINQLWRWDTLEDVIF